MSTTNEATEPPAKTPDAERASLQALDEDELKLVITRRGDMQG